jgi:3',5'-cyclic AMP phosphodiesterase CpdA
VLRPGLEVTFLVCADTHFGVQVPGGSDGRLVPIESLHSSCIHQMNTIAGRSWPAAIGGRVAAPRGVIVAGDLTEDGTAAQWAAFEKYYGRTGSDGMLRWPVFESIGNHDLVQGDLVSRKVAERHGATRYSWDWDDLHLVSLADGPDGAALEWLRADLEAVGRELPVVLFLHYPLLGPWSGGNWFGDGDFRARLANTIAPANVAAILHGHYHATGHYLWRQHPVYTPGSAKHEWRSFLVVRVTDQRVDVACWNYESRAWWWWVSRTLRASRAEPLEGVHNLGKTRPEIPYPVSRR